MKVTVIASGSKGNAIVIDLGRTRLAIDAGFGTRTLAQRYRAVGIAPESISACIITHEHSDHAKGALAARKRWRWTLAAPPATLAAISAPDEGPHITRLSAGREAAFGDARVRIIPVSHDAAAPAAVLVEDSLSGARIGVAYDLGIASDELAAAFSSLDVLVLEANHDAGMLRAGPYPLYLQDRIAGPRGHLNNLQSAEFAARVAHGHLRAVVLAHLSEQNNTPRAAHATVESRLRRTSFRGKLAVANQHVPSAVGDESKLQLRLL